MLSSTRTITTDLRHIDPNPDRIQLISSSLPPTNSNSLLLLSTSAEAAVAESKRFERGSRHSSLSVNSPPNHYSNHPRFNSTPTKLLHSSPNRHSSIPPQHSPPPPNHHLNNNPSLINRRDQSKSSHLFKCEKCLKVYRHPQCLVKHRWEHTEYWADASKLMLSKHQQVQMLEAAAILAAPSGSLPESRSLWPAAVSSSEAGLLGSDRVNLEVICSQRPNHKYNNRNSHYHRHSSSVSYRDPRRSSTNTDVEMSEETDSRRSIEEDSLEEEDEDKAEENEEEEEDDDDEIMFEMSLDGDESTYPNGLQSSTYNKPRANSRLSVESSGKLSNSSVSGPPPIGYFERRNPESVSSVISNFERNQRNSSSNSSSCTKSQKNRHLVTSLPAMVAYQPTKINHNHVMMKDPIINHHTSTIGFAYHSSESIFKPITPYQDSQLRFETPRRFSSNDDNHSSSSAKDHHNSNEPIHHLDTQDNKEEDDAWSRSVSRDPEPEREGDEVAGMEL